MSTLKRPQFNELLLTRVRLLTEDSVGLTFLVPPELVDDYPFTPGQYLTLRATVDGIDLRRCYSIASGVDDKRRLEVGIKAVPGGLFSNYACGLSAGVAMQVMTPQGNFNAPIGGKHRYLLVCAGSGITPCLSIIKSVLKAESESRITLLFGNQTINRIMFADDIKKLKDRYLERFSVIHMLSREQLDADLFAGRIDSNKIEKLAATGMLGGAGWDAAYCCGPEAMLDSITPALESLGLPAANIHRELFVLPDSDTGVSPLLSKQQGTATEVLTADAAGNRGDDSSQSAGEAQLAETVTAKIRVDGSEKQITVNGRDETVLQAAARQGLDLPFSCTGGMCCTCRCKLLEGKVSMDANFSLAKWEVEAGFVLACQSRAESTQLTLDFDAT